MKILPILLLATVAWGIPLDLFNDTSTCGYNSCHPVNESKINVHIVPHSHDDVGWLQTVNQYYYTEVQQILSSVVNALMENPDRRYIQVETAFFYMWWNLQTDKVKSEVQQLINEGRMEIVNGAWSMNDEAATHYQSIIDQYTLGLKFVQHNLGRCARPLTSWQIDTFGHSREQASLLSQFGMDGVYFARFDYRDRAKRLESKTMEMLWTGSENLGPDSNIFTGALYNHYSSPSGFCFDILCKDEPIVDDANSFEYNLEDKVKEFANFIKVQASYYATNNIIITMGDDFHYQAASNVYVNIDKLMAGFKQFNPLIDGKEVNLIYSTPSCYTKAIYDYVEAKNLKLDVKTDDFFPYSDKPTKVWTGYFVSRPGTKKLERISNNLLQVSKQLSALAGKPYETNEALSHALGVIQHHDAITGTERDEVQSDYHMQLVNGINLATKGAATSFSNIFNLSSDLNFVSCPQTNVSLCSVPNENEEFNIVVYNPLARVTSHYFQIPTQYKTYMEIQGPSGEVVESHRISLEDYFVEVPNKVSSMLIFKAEDLPALGYRVYSIKKTSSVKETNKVKAQVDQMGFEDNYINFDLRTGLLKSITLAGVTLNISQEFLYYKSSDVSDAWVFRPDSDERDAVLLNFKENSVWLNDGNLVREVKQTFQSGISQIIRVYKDENFIEFDWLIGSQDVSAGGKEFIVRYTPSLTDPHDEFFTDANGREMIKRKRNFRPTYTYSDEEPQSGNYYPVNTRIVVKNDTHEFAVLTDRSQGCSSLTPGQVELMVARTIPSVNEIEFGQPVKIRGSHYITFGKSEDGIGGRTMAAVEKDISQKKQLQPWLFFTTDDILVPEQSFINKELPSNVHLLTLESWNNTENTILIRLEHIFAKDEDPNLSKQVSVDLTGLFKTFDIHTMKEYMLAANIPLEESERLTWSQLEAVDPTSPLSKAQRLTRDETDLNIVLEPMQIRTFIATVVPK